MKINWAGWKREEKNMRPDMRKNFNRKRRLRKIKKNSKKLILRNIYLNRLMKKVIKKSKINKNITPRLKSGKKTMKNSKNLKPEKLLRNSKS